MRLTSDFWISALIRKVQGDGGFAYLARRGSKEAGAIFIKVSSRFGTGDLYSPAPQTSYEDDNDGERMFLRILHEADDEKINERMEREIRFDPDLWLVELEDVANPADLFCVSPEDL